MAQKQSILAWFLDHKTVKYCPILDFKGSISSKLLKLSLGNHFRGYPAIKTQPKGANCPKSQKRPQKWPFLNLFELREKCHLAVDLHLKFNTWLI